MIETTIAAPYERVWHALRDRDEIARWHGWEYDQLDEEIEIIYFRDVVADVEAGTISMADGSRIEVERASADTTVRIVMGAEPPAGYDDICEGWTSFLMQLRFALEHHPGEQRRTLQLNGSSLELGDELYRNDHQVGRVVDDYGPGLAIVHTKPDGSTMAIVTTYGLDDEEFAAVERSWRG